ncbi:hypothetical protein V3C99_018828 [Haemonchus contortus]
MSNRRSRAFKHRLNFGYETKVDRDKLVQYGDGMSRKHCIVPEVRRRLSRSCGHVNEFPAISKSHCYRKRPKKREFFIRGALFLDLSLFLTINES